MIFLLEDDDNIRKLVSYALKKEGYEVCPNAGPTEFWSNMETSQAELVILDIMLPEEDGLSILSKLRAKSLTSELPVIMLSAKSSEFDKVTALDMGADDYLSKPFGMTELISRVNALLRRANRSKSCDSYSIGKLFVEPKKHLVKVDGQEISLSFKEYTLLIVLLSAKGAVVNREKLLSDVWGEFYEESRTLDVHIRKLRIKLGEAGSLIQTVKNVGYKVGDTTNDQ